MYFEEFDKNGNFVQISKGELIKVNKGEKVECFINGYSKGVAFPENNCKMYVVFVDEEKGETIFDKMQKLINHKTKLYGRNQSLLRQDGEAE